MRSFVVMCARRSPPPPYSRKGVLLAGTVNPTGSPPVAQFPGDSYLNIQKLSKGLRRLRGDWERYGERRMRASSTNGKGSSFRDGLVAAKARVSASAAASCWAAASMKPANLDVESHNGPSLRSANALDETCFLEG